jgi:predicted phage tail protein
VKNQALLPLAAILIASPVWARQHGSRSTGSITLSTPALSFNGSSGNVSSQPLTITSTGQNAVTIQKLSFSNSVFSDSSVSLPVTLSRGQSLNVKVSAHPASTAQQGALTITSTGNNPTVSLSETATTKKPPSHSVTLTWGAPASGSDSVDSYQISRAVSGSTKYSVVGTATADSTTYTDTSVQAGQTYVYEIRPVDQEGTAGSPSSTITLAIP